MERVSGVAKTWDILMKMLVGANRQHLVSLVLPGAKYEHELNTELQSRTLEADLLYVVTWNAQKTILHVEFQRRRDGNMGRRLWKYNAQTAIITGLPVCSFVIYLKRDGKVAQSPYELKLPDREVVHCFYYRTIKLWELPAEALKQAGLEGLLPLLPLTKNGTKREVVEDMIVNLKAAGKNDLLPLGYAFAALVLKKLEDRDWLRKRFAMLQDILEDSWAYQEMVAKGLQQGLEQGLEQGLQKGLEQGLEQGLQKGEVRGLREAIVDVVQERFPEITVLARKQVDTLEDPALLRRLIVKISTVQTVKQAEQALATIAREKRKH